MFHTLFAPLKVWIYRRQFNGLQKRFFHYHFASSVVMDDRTKEEGQRETLSRLRALAVAAASLGIAGRSLSEEIQAFVDTREKEQHSRRTALQEIIRTRMGRRFPEPDMMRRRQDRNETAWEKQVREMEKRINRE